MKIKKIIVAVIAVLMLASLTFGGCAKKDGVSDDPNVPVVNPSDNVENPDNDDDNKGPEEPEKPDEPVYFNKLTGLETTEELSGIRPVAMMINNIKVATPQQGISQADVIYEVLAEGGITRLMCLFTDYASLPETGSIRSSRDYYIDLSDAHDAIYVHCGGSPAAYETLAARKTENMDGIYFSTPFYRNEWRKKNMGMEHSMMTTGELLVKGIEAKGYRTESDAKQPFSFNEKDTPISGEPAESLYLEYSYYATSEFNYDEDSGEYLKKQYDAPHIDSNNDEQLSFENVIILYCSQGAVQGDDKGRIAVNFIGTGDGYYMTDGAYKKIKWHKESRTSTYTLFEEDGETELLLNPGKSYIGIAPIGAETDFKAASDENL